MARRPFHDLGPAFQDLHESPGDGYHAHQDARSFAGTHTRRPASPGLAVSASENEGPLSSWNNSRTAASMAAGNSYQKRAAQPAAAASPSVHSQPRPGLSPAAPERYQSLPGHGAGTPGAVLSSSFDEGELELGEEGVGSPAAAVMAHLYGTPGRQEQRSPQRSPLGWVPQGLDPASYAAGERAAALSAFHRLLPTHQAMGQLMAALEALTRRLDEEAGQWRGLQLLHSKTATSVETALQRLDTLDYMRIPQLQEKCEEAAAAAHRGQGGPYPPELADTLLSLQQALSVLSQQQQQQQQGSSSVSGNSVQGSQLYLLACTAAGYVQHVLSKADVAAMFLSRKILLSEVKGARGSSWDVAAQRGAGAMLFMAAVEALWQVQQWLAARQSQQAREALRPLELSLRVARAAVWSAAAVLAVAGLKQGCASAAQAGCQALTFAALPRLHLCLPTLPPALARLAAMGPNAQPRGEKGAAGPSAA